MLYCEIPLWFYLWKSQKSFFGALHFDSISLCQILPDSTSKVMAYIFDSGDENREKSCGLRHIICRCLLYKNDCISYYEQWYFLEEMVIFQAAVFPKWGKLKGS
jgi:hypothetical protein